MHRKWYQATMQEVSPGHQIAWQKLAVALAVIRNKPNEQSAKIYTEQLQRDFLINQSSLQDKYRQAKWQILCLQQKLRASLPQQENEEMSFTTGNVCYFQGKRNSESDHTSQELSQDQVTQSSGKTYDRLTLPPSKEVADCISSKPASVNKGGKETIADCKLSGDIFPFNGCKDRVIEFSDTETVNQSGSCENSRFAHAANALQGLAREEVRAEVKDELVKEALSHIQTMAGALALDELTISESHLCQAAEGVTVFLGANQWLEDIDTFMHGICMFVERIIHRLMAPVASGQWPVQSQKQSLINMLLLFMNGTSRLLISSILDSLIESWESFCRALKMSEQCGAAIDPSVFESGYYLVCCMEFIMLVWSENCPVSQDVLQEAQVRLEITLKQIVGHFPEIAQALLKVTSIIETIQKCR